MPQHRIRGMKKSVPNSVDEYIAAQPEAVRLKLEQVRAAIRRAVGRSFSPRASAVGRPTGIGPAVDSVDGFIRPIRAALCVEPDVRVSSVCDVRCRHDNAGFVRHRADC
jgi:hypothetical protein